MTRDDLLKELRKPYACFVRLERSSIGPSPNAGAHLIWSREFSVFKGDLEAQIARAGKDERFDVTIKQVEGKRGYRQRDKLILTDWPRR